jgi:hypothetical protein
MDSNTLLFLLRIIISFLVISELSVIRSELLYVLNSGQ